MQLKIRRRVVFASLPLAGLALVLFLLSWGNGPTQKAHAAVDPAVNLSLSATGCDSSLGPFTCSVPAGATFVVSFNVLAQPAGGYTGYDLRVNWSGNVNYKVGSLKQTTAQDPGVSPSCALPTGELLTGTPKADPTQLSNGSLTATCANLSGTNQMYLGVLAKFTMTCKDSGSGTVKLVHGDGNSDLVDATFTVHSEAADESLTINCVPAVGGVSLDPQLPGSSRGSSGLLAGAMAAALAGAVALGGAAWYARRRRVR